MITKLKAIADYATLDEADLVAHALAGAPQAFRTIMQRHNRRLYRVARGIVGSDADAEDVLQEAYVRAFAHLSEFKGESRLSTWMTRIVINESLGRLRRERDLVDLSILDQPQEGQSKVLIFPGAPDPSDPEADAGRAQLRRLLEHAVDALPQEFRSVFMMREIEEMSIEETAAQLGIKPATVKTRLHRARRLLRHALDAELVCTMKDAFPFDGLRCARISDQVMQRLSKL
ncbi:RNA polymerase sigma factor [Microvirga solisilvae]|uniref:RNA polymerase sigma factor n=1 Tax=Microvirga solisilvae TaxID=2919498 RepID=UPI001FAF2FC2|nr:RNA polymerase sigma factor [Microvirga solisilvae]